MHEEPPENSCALAGAGGGVLAVHDEAAQPVCA